MKEIAGRPKNTETLKGLTLKTIIAKDKKDVIILPTMGYCLKCKDGLHKVQ